MATALCTLILPKVVQSNRGISRTRAVLTRDAKMKVPYEVKQGQSRLFHKLPSGLNMEVLFQKGLQPDEEEKRTCTENPPLVFVHGSFHAAWCWAEHWLPFFSQNGYDCYALSLLGQVPTPMFQQLQLYLIKGCRVGWKSRCLDFIMVIELY